MTLLSCLLLAQGVTPWPHSPRPTLTPTRKVHTWVCVPWHTYDGKTHIELLVPSAAGKQLSNLVALRAVLHSSLNCFAAASSPLLVLLLSFPLGSSSSFLESNLHHCMSCHAKASPCSSTELFVPIATSPCPLWHSSSVSRTVRSHWGFRAFHSAARDTRNTTARAWGILNKAAWISITHRWGLTFFPVVVDTCDFWP